MAQSTNAPFVDSPVTYAPTGYTHPQSTYAPFLDSGVGFGPTFTQAGVTTTDLEVKVGGTTVSCWNRTFREQLADVGSFGFTVHADDASGIDFDETVIFYLDGVARFMGIVEAKEVVSYSSGEAAGEVVNVSGRGSLALLDQAVVYPSRGVDVLPIEEVRSFSWPSPDFNSDDWASAKKVNRQRSYADTGSPLPHIWPDTSGWWIWANQSTTTALDAPQGICLFRKTFTLGSAATMRFFVAFDDVGRIWIDGAEMTWFSGKHIGRFIELELSSGTHTIGVKVANKTDVGSEANPAGMILAGYTVSANGLLGTLTVESDGTWDCMPYPVRAPGFTHGKVLRLLVEEAQADDSLQGVTLGFSDTVDSDGEPWGYYREVTAAVGRNLTDVVREMSDAFIDVAMSPGTKRLLAWNRGTRGATKSVTLQQTTDPTTSDFLELRHDGRHTRMNRALIRYRDGHVEETVSASITSYDSRGDYLELGSVDGEDEARAIAQALMENRDGPSYATSAVLAPRSDATTPYKAFEVGDTITCPDETGANLAMRVRSIAMNEDQDGIITWPIELRDERFEVEERHDAWLRRVAAGFAVGGARVSSRAGTPAPVTQQVTALRVAEFSFNNTQLSVSYSPIRAAETSGNMVEIVGQLTTAGSTTTTVVVYKGSTASGGTLSSPTTLGTLTFAAGETEASVALSIVPILANTNKLQCRISAAGTSAAGLDVQVRAI